MKLRTPPGLSPSVSMRSAQVSRARGGQDRGSKNVRLFFKYNILALKKKVVHMRGKGGENKCAAIFLRG